MPDTTARLTLPLIAPGQAQKELFHNEALALLDIGVHPLAIDGGIDTPPVAPAIGDCWIVGAAPEGEWAGHAQAIAGWTAGGWRFVAPIEGMDVWLARDTLPARFTGNAWKIGEIAAARLLIGGQPVVGPRGSAIAKPAGGDMIDAEARAAINTVIVALSTHGLIDP